MSLLDELDKRLQYGPAMRVQRGVEALFLGAAFFANDLRFAWVTFALTVLQAISPRLALVGVIVAAFKPAKAEHALGDLYFDLSGSRGACAISALVQGAGFWLAHVGHPAWGMLVLALPAASFLLAPTVGFCCGCACYVAARDGLVRLGILERFRNDSSDIDVGQTAPRH